MVRGTALFCIKENTFIALIKREKNVRLASGNLIIASIKIEFNSFKLE